MEAAGSASVPAPLLKTGLCRGRLGALLALLRLLALRPRAQALQRGGCSAQTDHPTHFLFYFGFWLFVFVSKLLCKESARRGPPRVQACVTPDFAVYRPETAHVETLAILFGFRGRACSSGTCATAG